MGGDNAPEVVIEGVELALTAEPALQVVLVGAKEATSHVAARYSEQITTIDTTEVIGMGESPTEAVRNKKDSSIVVGCKLVADGLADGFFSAGSTGAVMTAATLIVGRVKGIARPMIATLLPTITDGYVILGDIGANSDVKPEYLLQFARMGETYARLVRGVEQPRIGLLNIGEEESKGNEVTRQAYQLLSQELDSFVGNAEGNEILSGDFDVIITDGFTGNVVLKTIEGLTENLFKHFMQALAPALKDQAIAQVILPELAKLQKKLSAEEIGGAPLLGINGSCFIGHGSSTAKAIANGILATHSAAEVGLSTIISEAAK